MVQHTLLSTVEWHVAFRTIAKFLARVYIGTTQTHTVLYLGI